MDDERFIVQFPVVSAIRSGHADERFWTLGKVMADGRDLVSDLHAQEQDGADGTGSGGVQWRNGRVDMRLRRLLRQLIAPGETAIAAVASLRLSRVAILAHDGEHGWPRFVFALPNKDKIGGMTDDSRSATLGIAVSLLLFLCRPSGAGTVFATGDMDEQGNILPVKDVAEKLAIIAEKISTAPGDYPHPLHLFMPRMELKDGGTRPVLATHSDLIKTLFAPEITVEAVGHLREVADSLRCHRLAETPRRRLARWMSAILLLSAIGVLGGWLWLNRPRTLDVVTLWPMADSPIRAEKQDDGSFKPLPECQSMNLPAYRVGDHMVLKLRMSDALGTAGAFRGIFHTVVGISHDGGLRLFSNDLSFSSNADADADAGDGMVDYAFPIIPPTGQGVVIVLARRTGPYDGKALLAAARAEIDRLPPDQRINAGLNHFRSGNPGFAAFHYVALPPDDPSCLHRGMANQ